MTTVRTGRAWFYKEQLREILDRKQINVMRGMLEHWCTCVMRETSSHERGGARALPHGAVASLGRRPVRPNGCLASLEGCFEAAERRARGFVRLATHQDGIVLIAENSISTYGSTAVAAEYHLNFNRAYFVRSSFRYLT